MPDISKWNINKVIFLNCLFFRCKKLEYLPDISKWNINYAIFLNGMFMECTSLKKLPDISNWKIIENLNYEIIKIFVDLYKYYISFILNLEIDIGKINDFISSFCQIDYEDNLYLNGFDFSFPTINSIDDLLLPYFKIYIDIYNYLNSIPLLKTFLENIGNYFIKFAPKPNVDISCLFAGCSLLESIPDISKWNTKNIDNIYGLFAGCSSLKSLPDISK